MEYKLKNILEEIKRDPKIEKNIKLVVKEYKRKLGSVSINKRLIRINQKVLENEELTRKVLRHELLHIKLYTKGHTKEFFEF